MLQRSLRMLGVLLCAGVLLGASQCQQKQEDQTNGSPVFVTTLSLENSSGNVQSTFTTGQTVVLKLSVYNRSDAVQTLHFSSSEQYNFAVLNAGTGSIVWYWSADKGFTDALTQLVFQPHETQTFTVNWNQLDDNGIQLPAGQYEAIGGSTVMSLDGSTSTGTNLDDDAMAAFMPSPYQLTPTQFRSTLSLFTLD